MLPLAFYLLSFVLVFAKRPPVSHPWLVRKLPFLILIALIPAVCKTKLPLLALMAVYLLSLFAVLSFVMANSPAAAPRSAA